MGEEDVMRFPGGEGVFMAKQFSDPYGDLFIYYLKGRMIPDSTIVDRSFVGNWEEDGYSFLFFKRASLQAVEALTSRQPQLKLLDNFKMSYEEWQGGPVLPIQIGRIRVIPPWLETFARMDCLPEKSYPDEKRTIDILLDPGVVFGTGTHPTTRHCIEAIQMLASRTSIGTVIDIGTGTGLLAIAAVKLGCKRALAIDLNHLAVKTANANLHLNKMEDKVLAVQGSADKFVDLPSDLMISNIHYDVMQRLLRHDRKLPAQYVILSGLLRSQATKIEALLKQVPIILLEKWETNGTWYSYLGRVSNDRQ